MKKKKGTRTGTGTTLLLIVAALAVWGWQQWEESHRSGPASPKEWPGAPAETGNGRSNRDSGKKSGAPVRKGGYERFDGCVLIRHRNNDGDSFHVRLPDGRSKEFRLYFVDAPESHRKHYRGGDTNLDRIRHQAKYFKISADRAVEVGGEAQKRVAELLSRSPFTIFTKWEPVFESGRYFAFVRPGNGQWLHEWLVREGLARIYTKGEKLPDGTSEKQRKSRLRQIEAKARAAQKGAWALRQ
jgi:endonuclease YncB( thermonuclease family)